MSVRLSVFVILGIDRVDFVKASSSAACVAAGYSQTVHVHFGFEEGRTSWVGSDTSTELVFLDFDFGYQGFNVIWVLLWFVFYLSAETKCTLLTSIRLQLDVFFKAPGVYLSIGNLIWTKLSPSL